MSTRSNRRIVQNFVQNTFEIERLLYTRGLETHSNLQSGSNSGNYFFVPKL